MALFTVLQQRGRERHTDSKPVIEVIVEEKGGKQWALTNMAVSLITAKCDTMSKAIITVYSRAAGEIHYRRLTCTFYYKMGCPKLYYRV